MKTTVAAADAKAANEVPLTKLSKAALADRWGPLAAQADAIDDEIKALKAEFERRGLIVAEGKAFLVVKSSSSFDALKIPEIRTEMGAAWCAARSEKRDRTTFKVSAVGAAKSKTKAAK